MKKIQGDIVLLVTNNPDCPAAVYATDNAIPTHIYPRKGVAAARDIASLVETVRGQYRTDLVVLAGYLKKIPSELIQESPSVVMKCNLMMM